MKRFFRVSWSFIVEMSWVLYSTGICYLFLPKDPRKLYIKLSSTRVTDYFGYVSHGYSIEFLISHSKKELLRYYFLIREEDLFDEVSLEGAVIELRRFGEIPGVLYNYLRDNISEIYDMVIHEKIKLIL